MVAVGRARRRIWIAEAPTPELPPRMRREVGWGPVVWWLGRKGRGILRAEVMAAPAVQKQILGGGG